LGHSITSHILHSNNEKIMNFSNDKTSIFGVMLSNIHVIGDIS